jgi:drug/metabolite transporter (DMT)-like permease
MYSENAVVVPLQLQSQSGFQPLHAFSSGAMCAGVKTQAKVLLHERFVHSEFLGMALIVLAVFLLTTARVNRKTQNPEIAEP